MNPRKFLDIARRLLTRSAEEDWRTAANRAYYSLFLECRDALARWGFASSKSTSVHFFVRDRFYLTGNIDLTPLGNILHDLIQLRNRADYEMAAPQFHTSMECHKASNRAAVGLQLLDAIEADPTKLIAAAVLVDPLNLMAAIIRLLDDQPATRALPFRCCCLRAHSDSSDRGNVVDYLKSSGRNNNDRDDNAGDD